MFFAFNIFLNITDAGIEKFHICSSICHLSSILFSLQSKTFNTDKPLSSSNKFVFSKYLSKISFHLSLCKSLFSLFRKFLILFFAFAVFTNDNQNGFGFLFLSVIISTTSQLRNSLSKVLISQFIFTILILSQSSL
jgi:phosphate/sulfate permease